MGKPLVMRPLVYAGKCEFQIVRKIDGEQELCDCGEQAVINAGRTPLCEFHARYAYQGVCATELGHQLTGSRARRMFEDHIVAGRGLE